MIGSKLEDALEPAIPEWLREEWPFERPLFAGNDIDWEAWTELWDERRK